MDLKLEFTDKEISPWGGIYLMKKDVDKMDFDGIIKELSLPNQDQIGI